MTTAARAAGGRGRAGAGALRPITESPDGLHLTDAGNAELFAALYEGDLRYDYRRHEYLVWRGHHWARDVADEVTQLAVEAVRYRLREATDLPTSNSRHQAGAKWALQSEQKARIDALVALARSHPMIRDGDEWDGCPHLLGVPNGVVDLRTGQLREGRREDRITLQTRVPYDPTAVDARWAATVDEIFAGDVALREFVQRGIGCSLTGDRVDQLFMLYGPGRNGKGTVTQPVSRALGDYAAELPASALARDATGPAYELATLPGRRFVTCSEAGDTVRLHHDRIKQWAGGDELSVHNKYQKPFTFRPCFKLWMSCNHKPAVRDRSLAFWARVLLVPFPRTFLGVEDRSRRTTLTDDPEAQVAILTWAVQGAVAYYRAGLHPPASVQDATADYRRASDPLGDFLSECCVDDPEATVGPTEFYDRYSAWCAARRMTDRERLTMTAVGLLMAPRKTKSRTYGGLAWRTDG